MKSFILVISLFSFITYAADTLVHPCAENNMIHIVNQLDVCDMQGKQVTLVEGQVNCSSDKSQKQTIFCLIDQANNATMCYDHQIKADKAKAMINSKCVKVEDTLAIQSTTEVCANGKPVSLVTGEITITKDASPTKMIIYCLVDNANNALKCYNNQISRNEASTMIANKSCLPSNQSATGSSQETVSPK